VLDANGWRVMREFYYNDAGVQIDNLANSVQARALGKSPATPAGRKTATAATTSPTSRRPTCAARRWNSRTTSSTARRIRRTSTRSALRRRLPAPRAERRPAAYGVSFDVYFLESSLYTDGRVEETVRELVATATRTRKAARCGCAPPTSATTRTA
jgi:arginyl-tRNA synthetase